MRLSRRELLGALAASAIPAKALAWSDRRRVLVDRGLPDIARHLPPGAIVIDRAGDPVRQLQSLLAQSSSPIAGLTSGADMLVARGSAREQRRRFILAAQHGAIFQWTIEGVRSGKFRPGKDAMVFAADGTSTISNQHNALAPINAVPVTQHHRKRFIAGY